MKYNQWLDIWLENYVKPTSKIKTYSIGEEPNRRIIVDLK